MKRTKWYDGEQKPVYVGVYERKFGKASGYYPNTTFFTRWNGENWSKNRVTVDSANAQRHWAHLQHLPWRGVSQTTPEGGREMSDTPRTNFVAHETGDAEWDRSINRFGRMMAHACILERENVAQLAELHRISEALGTNEGHSSVTHIEILRKQLKDCSAVVDRQQEMLDRNADLRVKLEAARQEVEVQKAKAEKHYELGTEYFDLMVKADREIAGFRKLLKIDAVITPLEKNNERTD